MLDCSQKGLLILCVVHVSHIMSHVSHIISHVSHVIYHVSHIISHMFLIVSHIMLDVKMYSCKYDFSLQFYKHIEEAAFNKYFTLLQTYKRRHLQQILHLYKHIEEATFKNIQFTLLKTYIRHIKEDAYKTFTSI